MAQSTAVKMYQPAPAQAKPPSADELLRVMDVIESISEDWLYRMATPEARIRLLREHGLA